MKLAIISILTAATGCFAQSPTPSATPIKTGRYIFINLDMVETEHETCVPNAFNVDYGRDVSTVIGNPILATPVFDHYVKMELTADLCQ